MGDPEFAANLQLLLAEHGGRLLLSELPRAWSQLYERPLNASGNLAKLIKERAAGGEPRGCCSAAAAATARLLPRPPPLDGCRGRWCGDTRPHPASLP